MTDIIIRSNFIQGPKAKYEAVRQLAVRSVIKAIVATGIETVGTVAKKTGAMRGGYRQALSSSTGLKLTIGKKTIIVDGNEIMNLIASLGPNYTKHHIQQHVDYNDLYIGGYANPTTLNTSPIDMREVMKKIRQEVVERIREDAS